MAITTYGQYKALLTSSYQMIEDGRAAYGNVSSHTWSSWMNASLATIPSSSVTCSMTTDGTLLALPFYNMNSPSGTILPQIIMTSTTKGWVMVADRLCQHGGLAGNVVGAQTTNLPTAAYTRYTSSYAGNWAALEIYAAVGGTSVRVSGSYTNQDGVAGRTFQERWIGGGSGYSAAGIILFLPLQDGDTGVKSVENIALAATTGLAGNFGVTIFHPITTMMIPQVGCTQPFVIDAILNNGCQVGFIPDSNACLFYIYIPGSQFSSFGLWHGEFRFIGLP